MYHRKEGTHEYNSRITWYFFLEKKIYNHVIFMWSLNTIKPFSPNFKIIIIIYN